jgi:hypothetical protein
MICRGVPTNSDRYELVRSKDLIHHLMNKGIHPTYIDGMDYYFLKTMLLIRHVSEYEKNLKKGGR